MVFLFIVFSLYKTWSVNCSCPWNKQCLLLGRTFYILINEIIEPLLSITHLRLILVAAKFQQFWNETTSSFDICWDLWRQWQPILSYILAKLHPWRFQINFIQICNSPFSSFHESLLVFGSVLRIVESSWIHLLFMNIILIYIDISVTWHILTTFLIWLNIKKVLHLVGIIVVKRVYLEEVFEPFIGIS